jgi:hypothetical protein
MHPPEFTTTLNYFIFIDMRVNGGLMASFFDGGLDVGSSAVAQGATIRAACNF